MGRYIESDPIGIFDDLNTYAYVGSDPLSWVDHFGLGKVGQGIKWTRKAWNHVMKRHVDRTEYPAKSKFCDPCQIKKNAEKTVSRPDQVLPQAGGRARHERMFSRDIGTQGQQGQAVVVDKYKRVITTFPIDKLSVPGATLGVAIFGNNLLGEACDFFNPLSDVQDVLDLMQEEQQY